jgi:hypothetical protein
MIVEKTTLMTISKQPSPIYFMMYQKQLDSVEYFSCMGIVINDAARTREIKSRITPTKAAFNHKKAFFTSKLDFNVRKKLVRSYIWSTALYDADTLTLRKVHQE